MPKTDTHSANFSSRTIWVGDNLDIMRGMNDDTVDMIYLDPPSNSKSKDKSLPSGNHDFKDKWTTNDFSVADHGLLAEHCPEALAVIETIMRKQDEGAMAYCIFMAVRILEMRRILKPDTGHLFLYSDNSTGNYIKALLDAFFGEEAYRTNIIWEKSGPRSVNKRTFRRNADHILHYAMPKAKFRPIYVPLDDEYVKSNYRHNDNDGRGPYRLGSLSSLRHGGYEYSWKGYEPPAKGWRCSKKAMQELHDQGNLYYPVNKDGSPANKRCISKKNFLSDHKGIEIGNVWTDIARLKRGDSEFMGYPTQKPLELMHRIIECSTDKGDMVFDPFCGCASLLVAAENLQRGWAGCDVSGKAVDLLVERVVDRKDLLRRSDISKLRRPPRRDKSEKLPHYGTDQQTLFGMQKGICKECNLPYKFTDLFVDRIQPQELDGIENQQLLCEECVSDKKECVSDKKECVSDKKECVSDKKECVSDKKECVSDKKECVSDKKECVSDKKECVSDKEKITWGESITRLRQEKP